MTRVRARPGPAPGCELKTGDALPEQAADIPIPCACCGAQVPASTATALEGADYLWHFCGHDCLSRWCERIERAESALSPSQSRLRDAADGASGTEDGRIRFLLHRDGAKATVAWVERTLRIYRAAVLDKSHFARSGAYRRRFIESYCAFKRWLARMRADEHALQR